GVFLDLHRTDRFIMRALVEESLRVDSPLFALRLKFRRDIVRGLDALFGGRVDRFVPLALVSAVEGLSLELLREGGGDAAILRARATIGGLVALVAKPAG